MVDGIVGGHDALDPFVGEFGEHLFLHLLDGNRAFIGAHGAQAIRIVALALEGEALGLTYVHAKELLVETFGHESTPHRVDTAIGADPAEALSVEVDVDGDKEAVIGTDGWGSAVTKSEYMFMFARISASTSTSTGLKGGTVISTGSYELSVK